MNTCDSHVEIRKKDIDVDTDINVNSLLNCMNADGLEWAEQVTSTQTVIALYTHTDKHRQAQLVIIRTCFITLVHQVKNS